jgi:hypothetical protein
MPKESKEDILLRISSTNNNNYIPEYIIDPVTYKKEFNPDYPSPNRINKIDSIASNDSIIDTKGAVPEYKESLIIDSNTSIDSINNTKGAVPEYKESLTQHENSISSIRTKGAFPDYKKSEAILKKEEEEHIVTNCTFLIDSFKCIKSSNIEKQLTINQIFNKIRTGSNYINDVINARIAGKGTIEYDKIKATKIPTVRFNFNFNISASDINIKAPTGLIYIDLDNTDNIVHTNPYIYSCWKSVSNFGYGILVKVIGLTKDNFGATYKCISKELGIDSDLGAKKATQQTVLSYDPYLYINDNSLEYDAKGAIPEYKESEAPKEKKEKHIVTDCTLLTEHTGEIRFNNIDEYFIDDDSLYKVFKDKIAIVSPYIRKSVVGERTNNMFAYLSQIALLNPESGFKYLLQLANTYNKYCVPPLAEFKLHAIVNNIIKKRKNNELIVNKNQMRRLLFPPNNTLNKTEKREIINKEIGKIKTDKTQQEIYDIIGSWDFITNGKIDQIKVTNLSGKSIRTIKKYWNHYKQYVKELNNNFIKIDTKSVENNIIQPEPIIAVQNPKKEAMKENFDYIYKGSKTDAVTMTPAQFKKLTGGYFNHLPLKLIYDNCKEITKYDFEIFWKNIQQLKPLLKK